MRIDTGGIGRRLAVISICVSVLILLYPAHAARADSLSREELLNHLESAERSFRRGVELAESSPEGAREQYERALLHYERLAREERVRNGKL